MNKWIYTKNSPNYDTKTTQGSFISSGRGYFLSDLSDKKTSLGMIPKTPIFMNKHRSTILKIYNQNKTKHV